MSVYVEFETVISNTDHLVAALRQMGFSPEVHLQEKHLMNYWGRESTLSAHVIVPRDQLPRKSADIGFLLNKNGTYTAIADEDTGYGATWLESLSKAYLECELIADQTANGYTFIDKEVLEDGSVQLRFSEL